MAAAVLRGQSPAAVPFKLVTRIRHAFNVQAAQRLGIRIPADLLAKADEVIR